MGRPFNTQPKQFNLRMVDVQTHKVVMVQMWALTMKDLISRAQKEIPGVYLRKGHNRDIEMIKHKEEA